MWPVNAIRKSWSGEQGSSPTNERYECGWRPGSGPQGIRQRLHEFADGIDLAVLRNELERRRADLCAPGNRARNHGRRGSLGIRRSSRAASPTPACRGSESHPSRRAHATASRRASGASSAGEFVESALNLAVTTSEVEQHVDQPPGDGHGDFVVEYSPPDLEHADQVLPGEKVVGQHTSVARHAAGQFSRPRLHTAAAASDASGGVNGRAWTEHPARIALARNANSSAPPGIDGLASGRARTAGARATARGAAHVPVIRRSALAAVAEAHLPRRGHGSLRRPNPSGFVQCRLKVKSSGVAVHRVQCSEIRTRNGTGERRRAPPRAEPSRRVQERASLRGVTYLASSLRRSRSTATSNMSCSSSMKQVIQSIDLG